jgi:hypothetical protein
MPIRSLTSAVASWAGRLPGVAWPLAPIAPRRPSCAAILTCPLCDGELMCPRDWGTIDDAHWWVRLRCGDCEVWTEIVITNAQASFLDRALDRQQAQIRRAAERLDAERMAEDAAAFARALQRDLIVAADF